MKKKLKAIIAITIVTLSTILVSPRLFADEFTDWLTGGLLSLVQKIEENTYYTLVAVNGLPVLIQAWMQEDDTEETGTLQANMVKYINYSKDNDDTQISDQNSRFMKEFFSSSVPSYVNELTYTTLLGYPFSNDKQVDENGDPVDSSYNYVKNASGMNIKHYVPSSNWSGTDEAKKRYSDYYKTITAVQSFNTYVLSALYADSQNNFNLTKTQEALLKQASSTDWFVSVASEPIGVILRRILLFNSQNYVVMTKILEVQKQQLAAQSIANTLMIVGNQYTESNLYRNAIGNKGV